MTANPFTIIHCDNCERADPEDTACDCSCHLTVPEIHARFRAMAPNPDPYAGDVAAQLARNLAVLALRYTARQDASPEPLPLAEVHALVGSFSAVMLSAALAGADGNEVCITSRLIADAWRDGAGIREWLWERAAALGVDPAEAVRLERALIALHGAQLDGKLVRDLRGLICHWRAEAASWDGFTVAGEPGRNGGFAERAARYAACADAVEAVLAECALYDAETARDGTNRPGEDDRTPDAVASVSAADIMDAIRDMAIGEFEDAIREGTDRLLAEKLPEIEAAVRADERTRVLAAAGELRTTLVRPGNGPAHRQEVDVVPFAALRDLLAPVDPEPCGEHGEPARSPS